MRKRSILKYDSFDTSALPSSTTNSQGGANSDGGIKGVLKKDSSYDETLKPILKNFDEESNPQQSQPSVINSNPGQGNGGANPAAVRTSSLSSSSSEDLAKNSGHFSDVVIDPIPSSVGTKKSEVTEPFHFASNSLQTSEIKNFASMQRDLEPVIPVSSVKLSSDDRNLANKLEQLAVEADNIKKMKSQMKMAGNSNAVGSGDGKATVPEKR